MPSGVPQGNEKMMLEPMTTSSAPANEVKGSQDGSAEAEPFQGMAALAMPGRDSYQGTALAVPKEN